MGRPQVSTQKFEVSGHACPCSLSGRSRGVMEALADECRRAARVTQAEWTRSAAQLAAACTVLGGSHVARPADMPY